MLPGFRSRSGFISMSTKMPSTRHDSFPRILLRSTLTSRPTSPRLPSSVARATCIDGVREVIDAGAELVLFTPLDDEATQMERLAAEVVSAF